MRDDGPGGGGSNAKPGNGGDILGSGAAAKLLTTATDKGGHGESLPQDQRADPLRTPEFMGRDRHQIDAERLEIDRDLADGLNGIRMEQPALLMDDIGDLADRLDHAGLVIREHDGDKGRGFRRRQRRPQHINIENAVRRDRQAHRAFTGGGQHRIMFSRRDEQRPVRRRRESEIIRLRPAGGEDDFRRFAVDKIGKGGARLFHSTPRRSPRLMHRGRIAARRHHRRHRLHHLRVDRRGGVIVEIDGFAHGGYLSAAGGLHQDVRTWFSCPPSRRAFSWA